MRTISRGPLGAALAVAAMALAFALPVLAQATGAIHGTVVTADGEPLPGALLFLTSPELAAMKNAVSNDDGVFEFFNLGTGVYRLETSLPGFNTDISEVHITLDETTEIEIMLQLAPERQ